MRLPRFDYAAPRTLDEALALLADPGRRAIALAGGQTLLTQLAARAVHADLLVDLGRLSGPAGLRAIEDDDDTILLGALATHAQVASAAPVAVLREAATRIGTVAVRTRGTIGGSLAAALPAAEWCVTAVALDGRVRIAALEGVREVGVSDVLIPRGDDASASANALGGSEIIVGLRVRWPLLAGIAGHRDRVDGTPLLVVAAVIGVDESHVVRLAIGGIGPAPLSISVVVRSEDREDAAIADATAETLRIARGMLGESGATGALAVGLATRALKRMVASGRLSEGTKPIRPLDAETGST